MDKEPEGVKRTGLEIAVIALAGRFPGARNVEVFWENLKNGVDSITFFADEELAARGVGREVLDDPDFIKARGVVDDVEFFDPFFFNFKPVEAEVMDPQMRIFYECVMEVLETAGYNPETYDGLIGLYTGASSNSKWELLAVLSGKSQVLGDFALTHLIDRDFLSTRIAHRLNLRGPAVTLKTACSTGLMAVDLACRGLLTGQCDIALAGGVSIICDEEGGYFYKQGMIRSPDGHCRAFDARSEGVIFSDGAGIAALKRLTQAIDDGDTIYAVIKGSASNNDGLRKGTYEAPCVEGQADVIRMAHHISEVNPETITYVETHGTGTVVGDPIEIEGLKIAFNTAKKGYCAIGSVKTNVGHLDTAAGITGLIKTVLALKHRFIPPSLHFETPNPKIDFENSPFYVNTKLLEWKNEKYPLRAGVSSFGVGGTNVHVILEEAPEPGESSPGREWQMILLSARSETALNQTAGNLVEYFKESPEINLADAAYTLQVGRKAFKYRRMVISANAVEAIRLLASADDPSSPDFGMVHTSLSREKNRLVFMFPGQGAQYVNMGLGLYQTERDFRKVVDRCFDVLKPLMGYDIKEILYPAGDTRDEPAPDISQTEMTQPVIFVFEYALAQLLMKWGIKPYAMIGHSIGEYVAACLSGVFSLEDALKLVVYRGKLMQQMPSGAMLSVSLSEEKLKPLLMQHDRLSLAAVNAPSLCVVSGPHEAVDAFENELNAVGHQCRRLHTSHAFHSSMMDPILRKFAEVVRQVKLIKPELPYISNVTGKWITVEDALDPGYWVTHLRHTVRFTDGLSELLKEPDSIFIEVGPGQTLSTLVKRHTGKKTGQVTLNLVKHPKEDIADNYFLLSKIGQLWLYGENVDWPAFYSDEKRKRIPLPTYPFERRRYWLEGDPFKILGSKEYLNKPDLNKKPEIAEWFYVPSWKRSTISLQQSSETREHLNWLFFMDEGGLGSQLVERLKQTANDDNRTGNVVTVQMGEAFSDKGNVRYIVNPGQVADYHALVAELVKQDRIPNRIIHLWNVNDDGSRGSEIEWNGKYEDRGFYSLLYLAQAIGQEIVDEEIKITVLTGNMQDVSGEGDICPQKATVLGPAAVIPKEYPNISCCCIDVKVPEPGSRKETMLIDQLTAEFRAASGDNVIAYRNNFRLVQTFEPVRLEGSDKGTPRLKQGGVYLVTGGLGGIGFVIAGHLSAAVGAKLILTGRSFFPEREEWEQWLASHSQDDKISARIREIRELEKNGSEIMVFIADISDYRQMQAVITEAESRLGTINGVIHAAGIPGGGVIQLKTREQASRVLIPKVKGTLVLNRVLADHNLDFFVLCSSVNSIFPLMGQVDYYAANAFLDAFAYYKAAKDGIFTVSVNWDTWQEVGMAVEAAKQWAGIREVEHPLFDRFIQNRDGQKVYITNFDFYKHWVLNEHKMADAEKGLIPGVTYLEMAREAFARITGNGNNGTVGTVEISDVYFINPMIVGEGEEKEACFILNKQGDGYEFLVQSRIDADKVGWQKHAVGKIVGVETEPLKYDVNDMMNRCNQKEIIFSEKENESRGGLLIFGPRWKNIKRIHLGENRALACLELSETFTGDLDFFKLHPALLDSSTGFLFHHINEGSAYIPFSYKQLRINGPLPPKIYSYSRLIKDDESRKEALKFDITLMDEQGVELVDVKEFTMLEVSEEVRTRVREREGSSYGFTTGDLDFEEINNKQREFLEDGILPSEGIDAFNRILAGTLPQVIVSTIDLTARMENLRDSASVLPAEELEPEDKTSPRPLNTRPELSSTYVAPKSEKELTIANIWQEFLGIEQIGIHDNFFELGGDSLNIVQLNSRLKKALNRDIPVAALFRYLTISSFIQYLERGGEGEIDRQTEIKKSKNRLKKRLNRRQGTQDD